eukprot:TRINITY_DN6539_c0_g2_i1.p1 TRINITY_DN6539_c0_g2~~TRINITY_DN6539_c0_g2_i1.p1  ORF type:complete len:140 (-),score=16.44 TRINITY_DN6539_c0_g2_i1:15-434(-)
MHSSFLAPGIPSANCWFYDIQNTTALPPGISLDPLKERLYGTFDKLGNWETNFIATCYNGTIRMNLKPMIFNVALKRIPGSSTTDTMYILEGYQDSNRDWSNLIVIFSVVCLAFGIYVRHRAIISTESREILVTGMNGR